jgi:hypothetical protein
MPLRCQMKSVIIPKRKKSEPQPELSPENNDFSVGQKQFWSSGLSIDSIVDEIYNEQLQRGTFDNLSGKGKPLEISSGDVLNSTLKNANVLPDWLILQHEIKEHIQKLISSAHNDENKLEQELGEINKKINKYNTIVPSSILQKRMLTRENMQQQYKLWM